MGDGWHGPQGKGAMRRRRERKRLDAIARDTLTLPENRRRARTQMTPVPASELPDVERGPCGKPVYTKRDAGATARHRSRRLGRPLRIYPCEPCDGWHLTKQIEEDIA